MKLLNERGAVTLIEVVVGVGIVIILASAFFLRPERVIGVSTTGITLSQGNSTTFTANLMSKGWGFGAPTPVAGTITISGASSVVQITPLSSPVGTAGRTFTVNGYAGGTGTITVSGTSGAGGSNTHSVATIDVEVG